MVAQNDDTGTPTDPVAPSPDPREPDDETQTSSALRARRWLPLAILLLVAWGLWALFAPTGRDQPVAQQDRPSRAATPENDAAAAPATEVETETAADESAQAPPTEMASPVESDSLPAPSAEELAAIQRLCERIGGKLASVSKSECLRHDLRTSGATSVEDTPLLIVDYRPEDAPSEDAPRVLLLGGIHGDEYSSVTIVFKWMTLLAQQPPTTLRWRLLPLLNPDGLLRSRSQRMNAHGVDLNRNFPTPNWKQDATDYWIRRTGRNPRRYPGESPLSEPESQFLHAQIESFQPDMIVAVHAPLQVVDFDGPPEPPEHLGSLALRRMGTYPGSLGRYGGEHLGLPVVTIELPSAGIMPSPAEQQRIFRDLGDYIQRTLGDREAGASTGPTGAE